MSSRGNLDHSGLRWALGGLYYQFITTGPTISYDSHGVYAGSAVSVRLPKVKNGDVVDLSELKPVATGSSIESLPTDPPTPSIDSTSLAQRVNGFIQVQLYTEPMYYGYEEMVDYSKYQQLLHSWMSPHGIIKGLGKYMPIIQDTFTDVGYDAPPTTINKRVMQYHEPDMDWPHEAAIIKIVSEEFGSRTFIVAIDASCRFYCWVNQYDSYEMLSSPYSAQGQRINIPNEDVISLEVPFPDWVHVTSGDRRDTDYGDPQFDSVNYVWRFHPQGMKVVGVVLKRKTFSGSVYADTANSGANAFFQTDIGEVKLQASPSPVDLKNDWPGYVEFNINIAITGANKNDFTFGLTLAREQQADATHYPISADYLAPVYGGWATYGVSGSPGDLIVMDLASYWGEREQVWVDRFCGFAQLPNDYIRQTWARIINVDNNESLIKSILVKDQPSEFFIKTFGLDRPELATINALLGSICLSRLTFTYRVYKDNYRYTTSYYDEPAYGNQYYSRKKEQQSGMRYYVFGQVVNETQQGTDLDLWNSVDSCELFSGAVRFNPLQQHTRWLSSAYYSGVNRKHWFLNNCILGLTIDDGNLGEYVGTSLYYDGSWVANREGFDSYSNSGYRYITSEELPNELLNCLRNLSSSTTGDAYTFITGGTVGYDYHMGTYHSTIQDIDYEIKGQAFIRQEYTQYTNVLQELSDNGGGFDKEDYFINVLVPWAQEIWDQQPMPEISHGPASDGWHLFNETTSTYEWEDIQENGVTSNITLPSDRSILTVQHIKFNINTQICTPVDGDNRFNTYQVNKKNHRIYNYEIGAEAMVRQWLNCIEQGPLFLISTPEGYYAGASVNVPYQTGLIPSGILNTYLDYPTTEYSYSYQYAMDFDDYPSTSNQPNSNQFVFYTVDSIGHITGDITSHLALYEEAYQHTMTLPEPITSITNTSLDGNFTKYYYKKNYSYSSDIDFYDNVYEILVRPVLNGSMLFSK